MNVESDDRVVNNFHEVFAPIGRITLVTVTLSVFENISESKPGPMTPIDDEFCGLIVILGVVFAVSLIDVLANLFEDLSLVIFIIYSSEDKIDIRIIYNKI